MTQNTNISISKIRLFSILDNKLIIVFNSFKYKKQKMIENEIIAYVWVGTTSASPTTQFYFECSGAGGIISPGKFSLSAIATIVNQIKENQPETIIRIKTVPQESIMWIPYEKQIIACRELSADKVQELLKLLNR
jgi:hypothetical protein